MAERQCSGCGVEIVECMGFAKAGDIALALDGKLDRSQIRELCGYCGFDLTWSEAGLRKLTAAERHAMSGAPTP